MTRAERRRLLNADRRLAFGEELTALMNKYRLTPKVKGTYVALRVANDGESAPRFAIEGDGDLRDFEGRGWGDEMVAKERRIYDENVASGEFDDPGDTDEEEVEPKPEPKKLTLPLTDGQRVVLRDGRVATARMTTSAVIANLKVDDRMI